MTMNLTLRPIKTYGCCLVERSDDMQDSDIEVGDVLRIRQWGDMASEYTVVGNDIYIYNHSRLINIFVSSMCSLCGKAFTVKEKQVTSNGCMRYYSIENVEGFDGEWAWGITAGMLEPFEDDTDEFDVATDEDFFKLFS